MNVQLRDSQFLAAITKLSNGRPIERFDAEQQLMRRDPVLALLCIIEALADDRAENDLAGWAKQSKIQSLAREAIEKHTGAPFANPIYPGAK